MTKKSNNNNNGILNLLNLNNCLPKSILQKIIYNVHNGIFPSQQFLICMLVCKVWRSIINKTLKTLMFLNCDQEKTKSIMSLSILKQDYNESLESIIIRSPSNLESIIKILSSTTMPFFCKLSSTLFQPPLNSIEISSIPINDKCIDLISNQIQIYNIRNLTLKSVQLNDTQLITISKSLKLNLFNCLEHLDLSNNQFTKFGLEFLLTTLIDSNNQNQLDNLKNSNIFFNKNKNSLSNLSNSNSSNNINSSIGINNSSMNRNNRLSTSLPNQSLLVSSSSSNSSSSIDEIKQQQEGQQQQQQKIIKFTTTNEIIKNNLLLSHKPFLKLNLKTLNLSNNKRLDLDCITIIKDLLPRITSLKTLNLSNISLCPEGLSILIQYLKSTPTLKNINLSNNNIYPKGAEDIGLHYLTDNTTIRSFDISENKISLSGVKSILYSILGTSTTTANNNNNNNNNLLLVKSKSKLKSLYLRRTMIAFQESLIIRNLLFQTQYLKILDLSSNQIDTESMVIICESLSVNSSLTDLNLSFNLFGPSGCNELAKSLKLNKSLRYLQLHCVGMGKLGAQSISESLKSNTTLTHLALSNNEIKSAGCICFSKLLKVNNFIRYLDLSCNLIKNKGAIALKEIYLLNNNNNNNGNNNHDQQNIKIDINGNLITHKLFKSSSSKNNDENCNIM